MRLPVFYLLAASLPAVVRSVSTTDALQDADASQSGYLPSHNMDPSKLSTYKLAWTQTFNTGETFYAKPLVWTAPGASDESVILVSNQNIIRVLNPTTGAVQTQRTLAPPFQASDSDCGDIPTTIGITGTPIIDPATNIMYFYSKAYKGGVTGPAGTINGEYKLYAVNLPSLTDAPGFPLSMENRFASNDNTRYFVGGTVLQRPGLAFVGNSVVAGFGGHCDNFNFTGMLVTASKTSGGGVTNIQAMVASPGAPSPQPTDISVQQGGKAGIWHSGMGVAVDSANSRVYFVTGNGRGAGDLKGAAGVPTSGKTKISTLEQVVANFGVDGSGALTQQDWFAPSDYDNLNGGDRDFGSSGVALLDPGIFSGGGVTRLAIAPGKNGKVYIMDANNLGGFKNGDGQGDGVLQVITTTTSFFGGVASYPLEGGYIYFCPTGDVLYAYSFSIVNGKPLFTLAGKTAQVFAGKGVPVVTSLNGKAGTGIVWMADVNTGIVAYNAVPVNGVLQPYTVPATGRLTKFQRPVFGNTRIYTSSSNKVFGLAPPGALPPPPPVGSTTSTPPTQSSTSSSSSVRTSSTSSSSSSGSSGSSSSTVSSSSSSATVSPSTTSVSTTRSSSSSVSSSSTRTSTSYAPYTTPAPPTGKTITLNWNMTWVRAAPDGFSRPFIGINGQWPIPGVTVNYGDQLKINVYNGLVNETTAIHWHGIGQNTTNFEDGPAMVTQCPIPPGSTFVYQFRLNQLGTYWFHAHVGGQYIDGLRAPLIVKDPSPPYGKVDGDITVALSDVYHDQAPNLIHYFLSPENTDATGGAEPVPNAALINEAQNVRFSVAAGKTYLFRVINMGAIAGQYLQFDQHTMTIVEVDGVYVQPYDVTQLFVSMAQRYSVIIKAKTDNSKNFAVVASMNADMFGSSNTPAGMQPTATAYLVYDAAKALPAPFTLQVQPFDDSVLVPLDQMLLMDPPTQTIYLTVSIGQDARGGTRSFFNGISYVPPKVPTLYSALTAPADVRNNPTVYGTATNPFVIPYNAIVEININNHDSRAHPFHLHGHNFQLIFRADGGPNFPGLYTTPAMPMRRDTVTVYAESEATIRFRADNPGIQLFHCHTEWHVESGLTATFIEAPDQLVAQNPYIPASHREVCDNFGILRKGNAAGNSKQWLNLTGENTQPPANYYGALVNPPTSMKRELRVHERDFF